MCVVSPRARAPGHSARRYGGTAASATEDLTDCQSLAAERRNQEQPRPAPPSKARRDTGKTTQVHIQGNGNMFLFEFMTSTSPRDPERPGFIIILTD